MKTSLQCSTSVAHYCQTSLHIFKPASASSYLPSVARRAAAWQRNVVIYRHVKRLIKGHAGSYPSDSSHGRTCIPVYGHFAASQLTSAKEGQMQNQVTQSISYSISQTLSPAKDSRLPASLCPMPSKPPFLRRNMHPAIGHSQNRSVYPNTLLASQHSRP